MELQLLTDLQWDIHGLTASDFVDHFCLRIDELYGEKEGIKYVDRKKMEEEEKKLLKVTSTNTKKRRQTKKQKELELKTQKQNHLNQLVNRKKTWNRHKILEFINTLSISGTFIFEKPSLIAAICVLLASKHYIFKEKYQSYCQKIRQGILRRKLINKSVLSESNKNENLYVNVENGLDFDDLEVILFKFCGSANYSEFRRLSEKIRIELDLPEDPMKLPESPVLARNCGLLAMNGDSVPNLITYFWGVYGFYVFRQCAKNFQFLVREDPKKKKKTPLSIRRQIS